MTLSTEQSNPSNPSNLSNDHVHHDLAHDWFADHRDDGWATCAVTENGFVRVVSNPRYQPDAPRPAAVLDQLRRFCASGRHHSGLMRCARCRALQSVHGAWASPGD